MGSMVLSWALNISLRRGGERVLGRRQGLGEREEEKVWRIMWEVFWAYTTFLHDPLATWNIKGDWEIWWSQQLTG